MLTGLLEQHVGDLLGDGVVHGLCYLVHQSHEVLVQDTSAIQIVGLTNEVGETLGGCAIQIRKQFITWCENNYQ